MALLTRPATVQKDKAGTFTMDYAELAALPIVPEGYYKDTNNWKEVKVKIKHRDSNQYTNLAFKLPGTEASIIVSDRSRSGTWGIERIIIRDYDKGEVVIEKADIPNFEDFNFLVRSAATHGDINVANGQTVTIPSGGKRQYGDLYIASGGVLKLADGGGLTEIEVLGTCQIDGLVDAKNGQHLSGTWNATTVLGETLTHNIAQQVGGAGGTGEENGSITTSAEFFNFTYQSPSQSFYIPSLGTVKWQGVFKIDQQSPMGNSYTHADGYTYHRGTYHSTPYGSAMYYVYRTIGNIVEGGLSGLSVDGNGAGGGRAAQFGALGGSDASSIEAGIGAGQDDPSADEYGETGAHSTTQSEAGSGGFRGMHGQAFYLKAKRIDGIGTIDAAGQKGGDGGHGAEYLSEGLLYANGAGGGAAGGCGGSVWLRYEQGTPAITVSVAAGERGTAGTNADGAGLAEHGQAGLVGTVDSVTIGG